MKWFFINLGPSFDLIMDGDSFSRTTMSGDSISVFFGLVTCLKFYVSSFSEGFLILYLDKMSLKSSLGSSNTIFGFLKVGFAAFLI